jgi:hypothetical protein
MVGAVDPETIERNGHFANRRRATEFSTQAGYWCVIPRRQGDLALEFSEFSRKECPRSTHG